MNPYDVNKAAAQLKFNKGTLKSRKDAKFYIDNGYSPVRLLIHFNVNDDILQYLIALTAMDKMKYN